MIKDEKKKPPVAFAVQSEGITKLHNNNMQLLDVIRNLNGEQSCDILNRRYRLELFPGLRCASPLRNGADNPTSFIVNEEGYWHDFGASGKEQAHGDIIDFILLRDGVDFITTVGIIAAELGLDGTDIDNEQMFEVQRKRDALKLMMAELELVTQYSEQLLAVHPEIMDLVLARGLAVDFIRQRRIGFFDSIDGYRQWMSLQHPDTRLRLYVSNLEDRIIIPYFDASGSRVIYLIGRALR